MQIPVWFHGAFIGSVLLISSFAQAANGERTWQHRLPGGGTEYVILYEDDEHFVVEVIAETPGSLPRKTSSQAFKREAEALRFAQREAGPTALEQLTADSTPVHASPGVVTEISGTPLWAVTESWNWAWELRYEQWVKEQVTRDFFTQNQLATDCADVAYALRWIFARIHGLPAANRLAGSGVLFSQDSVQAEWLKLPVDADWRKDLRFRAALNYVLDLTYTHSLLRDSYPIAISVDSLIRGTHHLEIHGQSGHTFFVHRTDYSDTTTQPLEVMYSTTPRQVRELAQSGYWRHDQPKEGTGGFLRIRWPLRAPTVSSGWELASPETHPHFSREQFAPEFMKDRASFAEAVLIKLSPKLDFVDRLREGISFLQQMLRSRLEVVAQGYEICQRVGCPDKSQAFEDWSTFSRDARFKEVATQLELLVKNLSSALPKLKPVWDKAMIEPALTLEGETYTLAEVVYAWKAHVFSSNPRRPVAARWGLAPASFAAAFGHKLDLLLVERDKRMVAQGSNCAAPGACAPGSDAWTAWNSFDIDQDLRAATGLLGGYCLYAPAARCQALALAQKSVTVGAPIGRPLGLDQWSTLPFWLISDPRQSKDARWGAHRAVRRSFDFAGNAYSHVMVSESGLASISRSQSYVVSPSNTEVSYASERVFDFVAGHEILPPAGFSWRGFDPKHDRVIAFPALAPAEAPLEVKVMDPRSGSIAFKAGGFAANASLTAAWYMPGLLGVVAPSGETSLFDLKTDPVFEVHGLPGMKGYSDSQASFYSWLNVSLDGLSELIAYRGGEVFRHTFKDTFATGDRPLYLGTTGGDYVTGGYFFCATAPCDSYEHKGTFATHIRSGKTQFVSGPSESYALTPDARWAVLTSYASSNRKVELLELGPDLEVLSRRKIGVSFGHTSQTVGKYIQGIVKDEAGGSRMFRYVSGVWSELAFLADEKELFDFEGDFVHTITHRGVHRVRRFGGTQALFESEPGTRAMLIGSADEGNSLPAVLVVYPGASGDQAIFELDRPSVPLATGRFRDLQGNAQTAPSHSTWYPKLVTARGLLLPSGDGMRVWIDTLK